MMGNIFVQFTEGKKPNLFALAGNVLIPTVFFNVILTNICPYIRVSGRMILFANYTVKCTKIKYTKLFNDQIFTINFDCGILYISELWCKI